MEERKETYRIRQPLNREQYRIWLSDAMEDDPDFREMYMGWDEKRKKDYEKAVLADGKRVKIGRILMLIALVVVMIALLSEVLLLLSAMVSFLGKICHYGALYTVHTCL